MDNELKIKEFLKNNSGYISTSDFLKLNISKPLIKKYLDSGLIRKVSHGLYMDSNLLEDEYYIIQRKYSNVIFSHYTALYLLDFLYIEPTKIDISVERNKRVNGDYNIHYTSARYFDVGITEVKTRYGNTVKIYNVERCICDILRKESENNIELQNRVLDNYFESEDKDIKRLLEYSKIFNIYEKVNTLVEYAIR